VLFFFNESLDVPEKEASFGNLFGNRFSMVIELRIVLKE